MSSSKLFLERILPPGPHPVLAYRTPYTKPDGKHYFACEAFFSVAEAVEKAECCSSALGVLDLYVSVGQQIEARFAQRFKIPYTTRSTRNTAAIKTVFIDFDVKPGAYATTAEALAALDGFRARTGLPQPSFIVLSSPESDGEPTGSGFHVHWVLTRPLSVVEWRPIARALSAAARAFGLKVDLNVITNACCLLRLPGSRNFKHAPPRASRLHPSIGPDYDPDDQRRILAPFEPRHEPMRDPDQATVDADFDELFDAVRFLTQRGHFGPGCYGSMLGLIFALSVLIGDRPELHDAAVDLLHRVVRATGRDLAINESRFADAMTRSADRRAVGDPLTTPASIFRDALNAGWSPPRPEDNFDQDQLTALDRARRRLRDIFDDQDDCVAEQLVRSASRVRDPEVRAALAPSVAYWLALGGSGESALLSVIELLKGYRDAGLARWALRQRASL